LYDTILTTSYSNEPHRNSKPKKKEEDVTQAELEEMAVRKRRAEGTPCTAENFQLWKLKFDTEMAAFQKEQKLQEEQSITKKQEKLLAKKKVDKSGRLTGYDQFSDKVMGSLSMEEMEQAAQVDEDEEEYDEDEDDDVDNLEDLDEDLFDVEDDLDDLDSSDDDNEDDEDDVEIDI